MFKNCINWHTGGGFQAWMDNQKAEAQIWVFPAQTAALKQQKSVKSLRISQTSIPG